MPRGGKRPGAGAPKGNLNALKHGRRSRQFAELGALVARSSVTRETLLAIAKRWDEEDKKAHDVASSILAFVYARGIARGAGGLSAGGPSPDRRSIKGRSLGQAPPNRNSGEIEDTSPPHNQTPTSAPADNHPQIQNPDD